MGSGLLCRMLDGQLLDSLVVYLMYYAQQFAITDAVLHNILLIIHFMTVSNVLHFVFSVDFGA